MTHKLVGIQSPSSHFALKILSYIWVFDEINNFFFVYEIFLYFVYYDNEPINYSRYIIPIY